MPFLFAFTLFASATLLFLVQPMVAKMILPQLGGTPAVWNTCMVFFQAALLAGYAYAHGITRWLGQRKQIVVHLLVLILAFIALPIGIQEWPAPPSAVNPIPWLLLLLTACVGLPFFAISATAPLLQKWFAGTGHPSAKDPYFLYAASNLGSMISLIGYPMLVEPNLPLNATKFVSQSGLWTAGYVIFGILMCGCAWSLWRAPAPAETGAKTSRTRQVAEEDDEVDSLASSPVLTRLHWISLAFVPSSMMLSVTTHITLDIAAIPLLWIIPLALYLLSFILVFARWPEILHKFFVIATPLVLLLMMFIRVSEMSTGILISITLDLLALFFIAMVCHGELARRRPATRHLTEFYLLMSLGGVLGGLFNALLAPLLFQSVFEYEVTIIIACMLIPSFGLEGDLPVLRWVLQQCRIYLPANDADHRRGLRAIGVTLDVLIAMFVGVVAYALIWLLTTDTLHDGWLKWIHDQATSQLERLADGDRTKFFRIRNIPMFGIPTLICYSFVARPLRFGLAVAALIITAGLPVWEKNSQIVHRERSFFGVLQVEHVASKDLFKLMHGTTLHGEQIRQPEYQHQPLSYYHVTGPVGDVFRAMQGRGGPKDLALIGLGSGSLAAYGREGQRFTFYDIDPAVARIAKNPEYFTYLSDCKADYRIVLGDARLRIEGAEDHEYDLIVVDAFSSDSIPIHLITYEAVELYFKKLKKDGIVLMHISNRHLDLEPVLGNIAKAMGVGGLRRHDPFDNKMGKSTSDWVALAKDENGLKGLVRQNSWEMEANGLLGAGTLPFGGMLGPLSFTSTLNIDLSGGWVQNKNGDWEDDRYHLRHRLTGGWNEVATDKKVGVWNNDYSNLLSVFLWR